MSECRWAVAAAVSLKLSPHGTLIASQAGMLSAGGRCKTLDAAADGYVRSEGVGALVLSSCGVARAIAVLCGCAVRQDGRSASLTAPNGSARDELQTLRLGEWAVPVGELRSGGESVSTGGQAVGEADGRAPQGFMYSRFYVFQ